LKKRAGLRDLYSLVMHLRALGHGRGERLQRRDWGTDAASWSTRSMRTRMQWGKASVAENVTARAFGVKPQLRVIEGGQRDVRQPLEGTSKKVEDIALTD
jgi:hypothetical protein